MEGRLVKEEFVTKSIMLFLKEKEYFIIAFDFPQSGTGILLHPDKHIDKNDGIKPDIIAVKGNKLIVMENKNRYCKSDFMKLCKLKKGIDYTGDMEKLHRQYDATLLKVGVGVPDKIKIIEKATSCEHMIDFIIAVSQNGSCKVLLEEL
jgi:hypothetical protein